MKVHFCGVRGSTSAPGAEFARYGGDTSCVAIADDDGVPRLLLDAGTGIRNVTRLLDGAAFRGTILLGHLHWDHTQGLPFFAAGDRNDAEVDVYLPAQGDVSAERLLARVMSPPHFPIEPAQLQGSWTFSALGEGTGQIGDLTVLAREIPHKGGRTFGYRISDGSASVAYLSDHQPVVGEGAHHEAALALADGADLLIHDAQYTAAELPDRRHYGHATMDYAVSLGVAAGARQVVLFHHDPSRTDEELDAIAATVSAETLPVLVARQDLVVDLSLSGRVRSGRASP